MAQASGRNRAITSSNPRLIFNKREGKLAAGDSRTTPNSTKRYFVPASSPSTTPQPVFSLPGSIPKTRIFVRNDASFYYSFPYPVNLFVRLARSLQRLILGH